MFKPKDREEVPQFIDRLLAYALSEGASDLYLLPAKKSCEVRIRHRGRQETIAVLDAEYGAQSIVRLKVLAGLLTYKTKISQDGSFYFKEIFFRCASMPTICGERLTLRLLNSIENPMYLQDLGFTSSVVTAISSMLDKKQGLVILTGPTGSGKTTTLYAMVRELLRRNQDPASIISLEDPIEGDVPEISQVEVTSDGKWNYSAALKAALRQDVRTLMIGEMRDSEVVHVTLDAALTGHRVLTTYHAGDIPSIYSRLLHSGFESFLVASAITGCISLSLDFDEAMGVYKPQAQCLEVNDEWRDIIMNKPSLRELRILAEKFVVR